MSDEPPYDPDRMVPEDLDLADPAVARAYLDHPTTGKLTEDYGRAFRAKPPAEQQAELSHFITVREQLRAEWAADLDGLAPAAPERTLLQEQLDALDKQIEAAKLRMLELD